MIMHWQMQIVDTPYLDLQGTVWGYLVSALCSRYIAVTFLQITREKHP